MMFFLAVGGYYLMLEGILCSLLTQQHARRTIGALLKLAPGQLRTIGLLMTGGGLLALLVVSFHPFLAALCFYLILNGGTMLLFPAAGLRVIKMAFVLPQTMLINTSLAFLLGGGLLLWAA